MILIRKELIKNLREINDRLNNNQIGSDTRATLLQAKATTLIALQKYAIGIDGAVD